MVNIFKYLLFLLFSCSLYAQSINLKKDTWRLVGFSYDIDLYQLGLDDNDTIWSYKDGNWSCYVEGYDVSDICPTIGNIEGGSGFWIYSTNDKNITFEGTTPKEKEIKAGWNLITLSKSITKDYLNNSYTKIAWKCKDDQWSYYSPDNIVVDGFSTLTDIEETQAIWLYAKSDWQYIYLGNSKGVLDNGNFTPVTKSSTDDIEDIWNISFKVDSSNLNDFQIGVKFVKESTGAIGELVFTGLNISDGKIDDPDYILIRGVKSDGTSGGTYFYSKYNPDNILSNAIVLNGDILTLKLGTIMKKQTLVSESSFKAISSYNIGINSDKLTIKKSKIISLGNLSSFDMGDSFDNKQGIEGEIVVK